jgi:uncharacterized membrane protein YesL
MRIRPEVFLAATHTLYAALMSNLLLVVGCAPLVAGLLITDPARSWPLLAFVAPLGAPALVGVFAVMAAISAPGVWSPAPDGRGAPITVLATFGRAWRAALGRATAIGALAMLVLVILGVDIAWAWGKTIGAAAIPVLVTCMVLVASTTILALVTLAERPAVRLGAALRAALYLAVRRWYLTAVSLAAVLALARVIAERPAMGFGLLAFPLLYIVWAGSRYSLRPVLDPTPPDASARTAAPRSTTSARVGRPAAGSPA